MFLWLQRGRKKVLLRQSTEGGQLYERKQCRQLSNGRICISLFAWHSSPGLRSGSRVSDFSHVPETTRLIRNASKRRPAVRMQMNLSRIIHPSLFLSPCTFAELYDYYFYYCCSPLRSCRIQTEKSADYRFPSKHRHVRHLFEQKIIITQKRNRHPRMEAVSIRIEWRQAGALAITFLFNLITSYGYMQDLFI